MGDDFTFIQDGNILRGEEGIVQKVKNHANGILNKIKSSLGVDKSTKVEDVPDEFINQIASAFRDGALRYIPEVSINRDESKFETASGTTNTTNQSRDGNRLTTTSESGQHGSVTWKDGVNANVSMGDNFFKGGVGGHLGAGYKLSTVRNVSESVPNTDGYTCSGLDVEHSASAYLDTEGHGNAASNFFEPIHGSLPIKADGKAYCGYSYYNEAISNENVEIDGHAQRTVNLSSRKASVGARAGGHGHISVGEHSANINMDNSASAGYEASSKITDLNTIPNSEGYSIEGKDREYSASAHADAKSSVNGNYNILGHKGDINVSGSAHAHAKGKCSHTNFEERKVTSEGTTYRRVFHKVKAEGESSLEANLNAEGHAGEKSFQGDAGVRGYAEGRGEFVVAEWSHTDGKSGKSGNFDALGFEAEGKAGLDAHVNLKKSKSLQLSADGGMKGKGVYVDYDLRPKHERNRVSIGGVHAHVGHLNMKGRAGVKVNGGCGKELTGEVDYKLASVDALQADVKDKEETDEADIKLKGGLAHANVLNAKVVGERKGKKATVSMDNTLVQLNAGNVSVTGIDNRESNRTGINTRIQKSVSANIGNVDITGLGARESRFDANAGPGVDAFNFRAGIHRNTGGSVTTNRTQFCNIDLSIGPPNWNIAFGNSIGNIAIPFFGGGGGGGGGGGSSGGGQDGNGDNDGQASGGQGGGGNEGNNGQARGGQGGGGGSGGNNGQDGGGHGGGGGSGGNNGQDGGGQGGGGGSGGDNGQDGGGHGGGGGSGSYVIQGGGDGYWGQGGSVLGGNGSYGGQGGGEGYGGQGGGEGYGGQGGSRLGGNGNYDGQGGGEGYGGQGGGEGYGGQGGSRFGGSGSYVLQRRGEGYGGQGGSGNYVIQGRTGGYGGQGGRSVGSGGSGNANGTNTSTKRRSDGNGKYSSSKKGHLVNGEESGSGKGYAKGASGGYGKNGESSSKGDGILGTVGKAKISPEKEKPNLNLRKLDDQNKLIAQLVNNGVSSNKQSRTKSKKTSDVPVTSFDWSDTHKVTEDLLKSHIPGYQPESQSTSSSFSSSTAKSNQKPKKKEPPPKPFGSKGNIHTIFTIGAGDSKPIKQLKSNVFGFGNDDD